MFETTGILAIDARAQAVDDASRKELSHFLGIQGAWVQFSPCASETQTGAVSVSFEQLDSDVRSD